MGQFQGGARQILGKGAQGLPGGIAACDRADQLLQRAGTPELLEITHQSQLTVGVMAPTQPGALGQLHTHAHGLTLIGKATQVAAAHHRELQILKRLNQHILIAEDGWQDGEMGHGPTPDPSNPSEPNQSIQWPLPPDRPPAEARPLRLGVMASGAGSNFEALVAACQRGQLAATVCQLVVNNPGCGAEQRALRLGVPCTVHDHRSYATREALDKARSMGLDLVEVAANADPPVCRITDYGKYRYQQSKLKKEKPKSSTRIKEVKFRVRIEANDYNVKLAKAENFLDHGNKLRVQLQFRGREMAHQNLGMDLLKRVQDDTAEVAKIEAFPRLEGRQMLMVLSPK